jgi:hypothetical protein
MLLNFVIQKTCMSKSQLFANGGIIKNDKSMTDHVLLNDYNKVETWIALWEEIRDWLFHFCLCFWFQIQYI